LVAVSVIAPEFPDDSVNDDAVAALKAMSVPAVSVMLPAAAFARVPVNNCTTAPA
jgi:hypothetical protein